MTHFLDNYTTQEARQWAPLYIIINDALVYFVFRIYTTSTLRNILHGKYWSTSVVLNRSYRGYNATKNDFLGGSALCVSVLVRGYNDVNVSHGAGAENGGA